MSEATEPTDKELHALIEVIESDYDRSSGPGEAWSVEGLAQRILEAGFRAGAASQPTAAAIPDLSEPVRALLKPGEWLMGSMIWGYNRGIEEALESMAAYGLPTEEQR